MTTPDQVSVANLATPDPAPAPPAPAEPVQQSHGETEPFTVHGAVPGHAESAPSFADGTILPADQDEMSFFLPDSRKKDAAGEDDDETPKTTAKAAVHPTAETAAPPPAAPASTTASVGVSIDPNLLGIAEQFGMTQAEAQSYGDPAHLLRTLNILARQRTATATNAPGAPGATQQSAPPAPEPELVFPDATEMEAAGYDPNIIRLVQNTKAMHTTLKAKIEQYDKVLPGLVQSQQQQAAQARQAGITQTFKDAGFDAASFEPAVLNKIVSRVSALYQTYQREGVVPPVTDIIKTVIPLVVPGAQPAASKTNGNGNGQAVGANASKEAAAAQRTALAAARAKLMDRRVDGTFVALPTHRKGGEKVAGGALRQTMLDKGYDPGDAPVKDDGEMDVFLK